MKGASPLLERAKGFVESLRKVATQSHSLADGFHRGRQRPVGQGELFKSKPRHLDDDVIQCWLERCRRYLGDVVGNFIQAIPEREFRRDLRDRKARGFRSQCRTSGHPWVHLDDDDPPCRGLNRELNIAPTSVHSHQSDDLDTDIAQTLVLPVGQGESRSDSNGVTGVDTHRVHVFDRTDNDRVIGAISHEFEFVLFPPQYRLFQQDLGRRALVETIGHHPNEFLLVMSEAGPQAAHRVGGPNHEGIPQVFRERDGILHRGGDIAAGDVGTCL